jgi:Holliday junction resolvase RusA-like endonuclease
MSRRQPKKPKPPALDLQPIGERWRFEILGPPRTKKTSQRIARKRDGTPFIMSASFTKDWADSAIRQLRQQWHRAGAINQPVTVRAGIFRDRATGDANGYYQAIGDALQNAGVIMNDSLIAHWDGSRRLKDAANPRVVIYLTTVDA